MRRAAWHLPAWLTLRRAVVLVALGVAAWTAPLAGVAATRHDQTTADEPQYLMTAISLGEDRSLDVRDERAAARYHAFHPQLLPVQEARRADGTRISPHDPLLAFLVVPVLLGGWVGAKLALALLAGVLAGLMLWVAVVRFDVSLGVALLAVLTFSLAAPLAMYGTQIYPELPAALAVTVAVAALTGPMRRGGLVALGIALVAMPWLSVKYAPVVVVLAALGLWRLVRADRARVALALGGGLVAAAVAYLALHQLWYGGWTVYAAGSHFAGGETTVMGHAPDYVGRSVRLAGLLVDRGFGLAVWQPTYLLVVPAVAALAHRRPRGWDLLIGALVAGWLNATFVALTMQGWWWPGRQLVVVLPLAVLAVAWWAQQWSPARALLLVGATLGAFTYGWLLAEGLAGRINLVVDFESTTAPVVRTLRPLLPDLRLHPAGTDLLLGAWIVVLALLAIGGWRTVSAHGRAGARAATTSGTRRRRGNRRGSGMGPTLRVTIAALAACTFVLAGCSSEDDGARVRSNGCKTNTVPRTGPTSKHSSGRSCAGTGSGLSASALGALAKSPELKQAVTDYTVYVAAQTEDTIAKTKVLTDAVRAGDVAAAKAAFAPSRQGWESIEPIAGLVDEIDGATDSRVDDFEGVDDPKFTGWHRIEYELWKQNDAAAATPFADRLDQDLQTLKSKLATITITPLAMAQGSADLVEEVSDGKIVGEEDRYSHTDLWDFAANIAGAQKVIELLTPLLQGTDPDLLADINQDFSVVEGKLSKYRTPTGYRDFGALTAADARHLKADLAGLSEALAEVPGALGLG